MHGAPAVQSNSSNSVGWVFRGAGGARVTASYPLGSPQLGRDSASNDERSALPLLTGNAIRDSIDADNGAAGGDAAVDGAENSGDTCGEASGGDATGCDAAT
mmetsp:Transcript_87254/g.244883  ORF Transcript_87254/g.244883 Transcript_87254/m.244883 type:complete len:102 (+) Transcript_87254:214-519(+)